jgi:hypothetical protein
LSTNSGQLRTVAQGSAKLTLDIWGSRKMVFASNTMDNKLALTNLRAHRPTLTHEFYELLGYRGNRGRFQILQAKHLVVHTEPNTAVTKSAFSTDTPTLLRTHTPFSIVDAPSSIRSHDIVRRAPEKTPARGGCLTCRRHRRREVGRLTVLSQSCRTAWVRRSIRWTPCGRQKG